MKYELTTLRDVFDKVPADKIETCLHELAIAMHQAKATADLFRASASALAGQEVGCATLWPQTCTWIDDDKGTINLRFRLAEEGKEHD